MRYVFGEHTVDIARAEIRGPHGPVHVEPQVLDVIGVLLAHRDRVVGRTELLDTVWGDRFVSESALSSRIKAARRAVGDDGTRQAVIRTVHGRGYRWVAPVLEGDGAAGEESAAVAAEPPEEAAVDDVDGGLEQTIRFARRGGTSLAYATVGHGPPLVIGGWWMSQLELNWAIPTFRAFLTALARRRTVVSYDRPGRGLSGGALALDLDGEVETLVRVVDALGGRPVSVFGSSSAGPVAAAFAARRPELVDRLVLYGTYADGAAVAPAAVRRQLVDLVAAHWGLGSRVLTDLFLPDGTADERDAFVAFQRASGPAGFAAQALEATYSFDVRDELPRITAPTLVVHRRRDRAIAPRLGREIAASVPDARFVALEGSEHFPWRGDAAAVTRAVLAFLDEPRAAAPAPRGTGSADPNGLGVLTERERAVLQLVALGRSDREIARAMGLSPHTVHRHVANIRTKLDLPSRAAAAAHAARSGLIAT
ncbi:MAG TPA: alpha/beta fold hydrolase [Actinomycetospora sp.]|nr:alpha/beta fold hydrolase [Actinomycetospora sp.]